MDLLRSLATDLKDLVARQIELAAAELREKADQAAGAGVLIATGLLLALAALMVLLDALVAAMARQMPEWLAAGLVALVVAGLGSALLAKGWRDLRSDNLKPRRTLEMLRHDRERIKEQLP